MPEQTKPLKLYVSKTFTGITVVPDAVHAGHGFGNADVSWRSAERSAKAP